jgi:hypothetical protein
MSEMIEGKVAQILSERCLILNIGTGHGVQPGMVFVVLAQGGAVRDPDTGESLGRAELPKGMVRVTHAQPRMSTCEAYDPHAATEDDPTNVLSAAMITHSMRPESWGGGASQGLNVNQSQIMGMPEVGPISEGDLVRESRPGEQASPTPLAETSDASTADSADATSENG